MMFGYRRGSIKAQRSKSNRPKWVGGVGGRGMRGEGGKEEMDGLRKGWGGRSEKGSRGVRWRE